MDSILSQKNLGHCIAKMGLPYIVIIYMTLKVLSVNGYT
jgi:hypothetical protein